LSKSLALAANTVLFNLQDYILPVEYVNTMRDYMLDKCPVSSYKDIAEVIEQDLGRKPEELFASIEQVPIASASLAQVQMLTSCMNSWITHVSSPWVRHVQTSAAFLYGILSRHSGYQQRVVVCSQSYWTISCLASVQSYISSCGLCHWCKNYFVRVRQSLQTPCQVQPHARPGYLL
jgi:hypothetical protein